MALTHAEKQELIITHSDVHHSFVSTLWKYTFKNGKGYVIYDFESAVTLTWNQYDNENNLQLSYTYQYHYDDAAKEIKITWNPKNKNSGDIFEVTDDKLICHKKKIVVEKV